MLLPCLTFGPMVLGAIAYFAGKRNKTLRSVLVGACGVAVMAGCLLLWTGEKSFTLPGFCGLGLHLRADGFRSLYATVAAFMWMVTGLFAPDYFAHYHNRGRYSFFNLMTLGATLGVFLSDDLYTTFIFFEIMSLTSYTWVAHEETPAAMKAAGTYLAVAVIGGLTTLMGLMMLYHQLGTLSFAALREALSSADETIKRAVVVPSWLVLFGFAAKAGMFPLHIWLPKAHPVAPAPASALLSGILTKSGVFGVIVLCANVRMGSAAFANALLALAAITMFAGAVLALLSVDLKRTLACSSMSQIGFITVGLSMMVLLGQDGQLAAYGAVLHMVNHSLIKLCLFCCAGVVYMNLHRLSLNDVRGFGRRKPLLHLSFALGALSIACIPPLGSGYNSKSLLHEGILEYIAHVQSHGGVWLPYKALEILFLVSGGLTVAYMLKLYICLFWQKHPTRQEEFDAKKRYMRPLSGCVLLLSAIVLPLLGALPSVLMSPLAERSMPFLAQEPLAHPIHYFSAENLIGAGESIAIGVCVYLFIVRPLLTRNERGVRVYVNRWPAWLDVEELIYRPVLMKLLPDVLGAVTSWIAGIPESRLVKIVIPQTVTAITRFLCELPEYVTLFLHETVLGKRKPVRPAPVGTRFTYTTGLWLNRVCGVLNRSILKRHPLPTDHELRMAEARDSIRSIYAACTRSVSFGLLMTGAGLVLICIYLLTK